MKERQSNIYDILDHLEKRRALYLGNHQNFNSLDSFVTGFTIAASVQQLRHERYPDFNLFSIWLLGHLKKHYGQSGGWHWQIRSRNLKNDEKAFKEFFVFLDTFKKTKLNRRELELDQDSIEYYIKNVKQFRVVDGKQIRIMTRPAKIIWTSFSNSTTIILDYVDKKGKEVGGGWEIGQKKAMECLNRSFGEVRIKWKKVQ
jgi:hypothetical protein